MAAPGGEAGRSSHGVEAVFRYLQGRYDFMGAKRISEETKLQAVMDMLEGNGSHAEICTR